MLYSRNRIAAAALALCSCQQGPLASKKANHEENAQISIVDKWRQAAAGERIIEKCILSVPLERFSDIKDYQSLRLTIEKADSAIKFPRYLSYADGDDLFILLSKECRDREKLANLLEKYIASAGKAGHVSVLIPDPGTAANVVRTLAEYPAE